MMNQYPDTTFMIMIIININNQESMEPNSQKCEPTINGTWQELETTKTSPDILPFLNRSHHAAFYFKNALFLYGGELNNQPQLQRSQEDCAQKNGVNSLLCSSHFFRFAFSNKEWIKVPLNLPLNHSLSYVTSFGFTVQSNFLYVFGGQNSQSKELRPPELIIINLDTSVGKKLQTKGTVPNPTLSPNLLFLNKGSLLLYGGQICNKITGAHEYTNDIYVYKLESRTWIKTEDNYKCKLPTLINPFLLTLTENQLYIFGGSREMVSFDGDSNSHQVQNTAFYKLKPVSKITSAKPDVLVRNVYATNQPPFGGLITKSFSYFQKYLVCLTKKSEEDDEFSTLWFFDASKVTWVEVKQDDISLPFKIRCSASTSFIPFGEKIFTIQSDGKVAQLFVSLPVLEKDVKHANEVCPHNLCNLCASKKLSLNLASVQVQPPLLNAKRFKQNFDNLNFPFAAMGLLVDNAVMTDSKNCNILFGVNNLGKQSNMDGNKFIIVEDNGHSNLIWNKEITPEMFIEISRSIFVTGLVDDTMAQENIKEQIERSLKDVDKKDKSREKDLALFLKQQAKGAQNLPLTALVNNKTEKDFEKEHIENLEKRHRLEHKRKISSINRNRKKYITNLKAAGVRLGDVVVYACKDKTHQSMDPNSEIKQIRRYILMVPQLNETTKELDYIIYSYMTINGTISDPKMEQVYKHAAKEYKRELKLVTERMKSMNNVVYIGNLKKIEVEDGSKVNEGPEPATIYTTELQYRKKYNDIFYGDPHRLNSLEAIQQISISECCDISLKAYLSLLYLRQQDFTLSISVKQNPLETINSQPFLPHIDRMAKSKKIYDLQDCFQFGDQCNIVEIYWNSDGWKADHGPKHTNVSFVLNGVLIYHEGRLISRFKTELGELLDSLDEDPQFGCMFGYIEVKDMFPVNMLKTDFTYAGIMEKYYARLKCVGEYMRGHSKAKRTRPRPDDGKIQHKITKRIKND